MLFVVYKEYAGFDITNIAAEKYFDKVAVAVV